MNGLRYLVNVMQDAVDAEADEGNVSLGLDMDVRGPARIGVMEKILYGVDDMLVRCLKLNDRLQLYELFEVPEVCRSVDFFIRGSNGRLKTIEFRNDLEDIRLSR